MCFPYGGKLCVRNESLERWRKAQRKFPLVFLFFIIICVRVFGGWIWSRITSFHCFLFIFILFASLLVEFSTIEQGTKKGKSHKQNLKPMFGGGRWFVGVDNLIFQLLYFFFLSSMTSISLKGPFFLCVCLCIFYVQEFHLFNSISILSFFNYNYPWIFLRNISHSIIKVNIHPVNLFIS